MRGCKTAKYLNKNGKSAAAFDSCLETGRAIRPNRFKQIQTATKGPHMPLELRKTSNWWYGRYQSSGKVQCINIGVRVEGNRPASIKETGDLRFERSRGKAQEALDRLLQDARRQKTEIQILEELYRQRTGHKIRRVAIADLAQEWERTPRKKQPSARYGDLCRATLKRFQGHIAANQPNLIDITQITKDMAAAFLKGEEERGISDSTWNDILKTVRSALRHALPPFHVNPFAEFPLRETETIHRKAFSPEQLGKILQVARDDDFVRPLVVTAMATAMRRGDCCLLKWSDVDLGQRFITVKTSKTGETVEIPVFPLLYSELLRWIGKSDAYVFPEQARMYLTNPDGVSYRVGRVLHKAGFVPQNSAAVPLQQVHRRDRVPAAQIQARAREQIGSTQGATTTAKKKQNMLKALALYIDGDNLDAVAGKLGLSRGCVSNYLNQLEELCGAEIIRRRDGLLCQATDEMVPKQVVRRKGRRRASLRDFHSFRVSWITLALSAGVPMELVRKVTGHRCAEVVLKHYFKPDRAEFSRALNDAMPALLLQDSIKDIGGLDDITSENPVVHEGCHTIAPHDATAANPPRLRPSPPAAAPSSPT